MSSPKEKTRRTYTRRAPKTKIMDTLQELKDLIERHCGEREEAIQQTARVTAAEVVAALGQTPAVYSPPESPLAYPASSSALPPSFIPQPARMLVPNPGGPSEWNQFMQTFKEKYEAEARARGNDRKKIPYMEVLKAGKEAYQAKKVNEGRTTRKRAPTVKAAPLNVNALVAPLTQRMNAANEQRRQLAAKIEVYKTAMPKEVQELRGMMNKATQGRADLDAAIAALRGKKLSAAATKKAEALIQDAARNFNAQTVRIEEATRKLNSDMETMRAKKAARRVSTLNNRGMTPRNEQYFNPQTPIDEEYEGANVGLNNNSSTRSSSSSNNSSTGSSSSSNNSSTGSSSSSNNSSTGSSNGSSTGSRNSPSLSPARARTPSPVAVISPNKFSNFQYNNSGPDEETGTRKVTIKGKKYYLLPDGELVDRGDNSDPNAIGSNIVGVWKNGSIQEYVPPTSE